ncbi:F0F1 ATP synthase subunit gamma [Lyticum sinuosum]|uniref:ATP synthase gamma chain n=1 Tax=Lyticum sinuosum TaxID=1332059 RepID=A0AAE4VMB4_9RICK|nr:FoF1 ATP synthase subunit gamma [Lyticum sinuosum]MDZ5761304.1 ATP synthase gamma chain [Lyticum sinuosum]
MSLRAIKTRIKSIESSKKITDAMQFISAARAKQLQKIYTKSIDHMNKVHEIISSIDESEFENCRSFNKFSDLYKDAKMLRSDDQLSLNDIPLTFHKRKFVVDKSGTKNKRHLIIVISGDRGLCGQYNSLPIKKSQILSADIHNSTDSVNHEIDYITIGSKANDAIQNMIKLGCIRDSHICSCFLDKNINFESIRKAIILPIFHEMTVCDYEDCSIVYNHNESVSKQRLEVCSIWPVTKFIKNEKSTYNIKKSDKYLYFDPEPVKILSNLILNYIEAKIYQILVNAKLAEHNARMIAMDNARRNSEKAINKLKNYYNNARQESITKEISEIVSGSESSLEQ